MSGYLHRVDRFHRDMPHPPPPLPKDAWLGSDFIEADGTVLAVVPMPVFEWPARSSDGHQRVYGKRHTPA